MTVKRKYNIQGTVSSKRDGRGIPDLRVEVWDKDLLIDDLLGSAKTDEKGRFTLSFDETYYQEPCRVHSMHHKRHWLWQQNMIDGTNGCL